MELNSNSESEPLSKTQLKQEATKLQKLGKKLTSYSSGFLQKLPIEPVLISAIAEFNRLPNSQSGTVERLDQAVLRLPSLSGRYIGEMEQVAETFEAIGLTPDIHKGAADLFRLLNASPLASERREEIDPDRTTSDVLRMLSKSLPGTPD